MKSRFNFNIEYSDGRKVDMHEKGLWVSFFRVSSPNAEREIYEHSGIPGGRLISSRIGVRKVQIGFSFEKSTLEELDSFKHEVYQIFYHKDEYKIVRDMYPDKKLMALHQGEYDIQNVTGTDGEFEIELTMLDPFIYGGMKEITLTGQAINLGPVEYRPTITAKFTVAASSFKVAHQESGKFVEVKYGFVAGDLLVIDFNTRKIIINNNVRMTAFTLKSRFFDFVPFTNRLTVAPASVATVKLLYEPKSM
ncbi:phage distal tail protein [Rossellomorea marisflavi]|uniref:phage distal tail protein n=1 Tax=Rossellomorea marisflavi TaxID=189381 RepID=UPI003D2EB700